VAFCGKLLVAVILKLGCALVVRKIGVVAIVKASLTPDMVTEIGTAACLVTSVVANQSVV
jgi:hypothetical protein